MPYGYQTGNHPGNGQYQQQQRYHPQMNAQYQQHPNAMPVQPGQQQGYNNPQMNVQYAQHPNAMPVQQGQQQGYNNPHMNAQYQQAPAMQHQGQANPNIQYQQHPNAVPVQNVHQENQQQVNHQASAGQQVPLNAAIPNQPSHIDQKPVAPVANNPNAINANDKQ